MMSWRNFKDKIVLREVVDQGSRGYCWNISTSRMVSAHLYIHDKVQSLLPLSAKHLFVGVEGKHPDGSLKRFEPLRDFLVNDGMIHEKECRCISETDKGSGSSKSNTKMKKNSSKLEKVDPCFGKLKGKEIFKIKNLQIIRDVDEKKLINLLHKGPIAVSIKIKYDFKQFKGDGVYREPKKDSKNYSEDHMVLFTGYGTTTDGINYWEFQNSYGLNWGKDGFGKLIRQSSRENGEPCIITAFIYPELLD